MGSVRSCTRASIFISGVFLVATLGLSLSQVTNSPPKNHRNTQRARESPRNGSDVGLVCQSRDARLSGVKRPNGGGEMNCPVVVDLEWLEEHKAVIRCGYPRQFFVTIEAEGLTIKGYTLLSAAQTIRRRWLADRSKGQQAGGSSGE